MALAPLLIPQPQVDNSFNFAPLARLGQIDRPDTTLASLARTAAPSTTSTPSMPSGDAYSRAISGIESGGRYDLMGPVTKTGDRAYGKYQIMGANIPGWTQAALGTSMTPQEFLADTDAQETVFKHRFGQYVDKYGPVGAAKAWFAGEGGMNNPSASDLYGTTVDSYAKRFQAGLGEQ
jgi:hypothetical protein